MADIPEVLAEVNLLEGDLTRELVQLIDIRNQLVYDPDKGEALHSHGLPGCLVSLERFVRAIRGDVQAAIKAVIQD